MGQRWLTGDGRAAPAGMRPGAWAAAKSQAEVRATGTGRAPRIMPFALPDKTPSPQSGAGPRGPDRRAGEESRYGALAMPREPLPRQLPCPPDSQSWPPIPGYEHCYWRTPSVPGMPPQLPWRAEAQQTPVPQSARVGDLVASADGPCMDVCGGAIQFFMAGVCNLYFGVAKGSLAFVVEWLDGGGPNTGPTPPLWNQTNAELKNWDGAEYVPVRVKSGPECSELWTPMYIGFRSTLYPSWGGGESDINTESWDLTHWTEATYGENSIPTCVARDIEGMGLFPTPGLLDDEQCALPHPQFSLPIPLGSVQDLNLPCFTSGRATVAAPGYGSLYSGFSGAQLSAVFGPGLGSVAASAIAPAQLPKVLKYSAFPWFSSNPAHQFFPLAGVHLTLGDLAGTALSNRLNAKYTYGFSYASRMVTVSSLLGCCAPKNLSVKVMP